MENDELGNEVLRLDGNEFVRIDNGFLVDEDTYVVNSDDVLEQEENNSDSNGGKNAPLREQDRFLPIANIAKIMKRAVPSKGKIAKDARECIQECLSEFISFVTSEASDRCMVEKRKTINGEDILFALNALGFDNYVEPLKLYLKKYRELLVATMPNCNKMSQQMILYEDGIQDHSENEGEIQSDGTTVIYTYNKDMSQFE